MANGEPHDDVEEPAIGCGERHLAFDAGRLRDVISVALENVTKRFERGTERVLALDRVSLEVPAGQFCAVMGPSGSGKSTLLHLAAGIDRPSGGRVLVGGTDLAELSDDRRTLLRRRRIGLVFQNYRLFPHLTVLDNVAFGPVARGVDRSEARHQAAEWLARVGIADLARARPRAISGGEAQRVALARALATRPRLLLLDEPLAHLDLDGVEAVDPLIGRASGRSRVLVTHDVRGALVEADRALALHRDGEVAYEGPVSGLSDSEATAIFGGGP